MQFVEIEDADDAEEFFKNYKCVPHDFTDFVTYPNIPELFVRMSSKSGKNSHIDVKNKTIASRILEILKHRESALSMLLCNNGENVTENVAFFFDQVPAECVITLVNRMKKIHDLSGVNVAYRKVYCLIRKSAGHNEGMQDDEFDHEECLQPGELNHTYLTWCKYLIHFRKHSQFNMITNFFNAIALCSLLEQKMQETMTWSNLPMLSAISNFVTITMVANYGKLPDCRFTYPTTAIRKLRGGTTKNVETVLHEIFENS